MTNNYIKNKVVIIDNNITATIIEEYKRVWTLLHQYDQGTLKVYRGERCHGVTYDEFTGVKA